MKQNIEQIKSEQGWTLIETMIVVAIVTILSSMAIPAYNAWLPDSRLKSAGQDVFSVMQKARMLAIKDNSNIDVVFDSTGANNFYYLDVNQDGVWQAGEVRQVMADYKSGVDFASATPGCVASDTGWSTNPNDASATKVVTWNPNGTANNSAVYLENKNQDTCYGVSVYISGLIKLRKFDGTTWY